MRFSRATSRLWYASLLLVAALALRGATLFAEEQSEQNAAEAKQAAEEEKAEMKRAQERDCPVFSTLQGKLTLRKIADPKNLPPVVGILEAKGRTYQLKLNKSDLYTELAKVDGKTVSLDGKPRNQGKYLIVLNVRGVADDKSAPK